MKKNNAWDEAKIKLQAEEDVANRILLNRQLMEENAENNRMIIDDHVRIYVRGFKDGFKMFEELQKERRVVIGLDGGIKLDE